MKKLATWLGIAAIALQIAWPLIAVAKPRGVTLVPLCTVDGVTHYLEVPTGKAPVEQSSSHGGHCPLCFVGERAALPARFPLLALDDGLGTERVAPPASRFVRPTVGPRRARAPPAASFG
jgi:hypothetical protein